MKSYEKKYKNLFEQVEKNVAEKEIQNSYQLNNDIQPLFSQNKIISLANKLGYQANDKGICTGIAVMTAQACIIGQLDVLIERFQLINNESVDDIVQQIEVARDKFKKLARVELLNNKIKQLQASKSDLQKVLKLQTELLQSKQEAESIVITPKERKLLEIPPFLEGVELFFQPQLYREFTRVSTTADLKRIEFKEDMLSQSACHLENIFPFTTPQLLDVKQADGSYKAKKINQVAYTGKPYTADEFNAHINMIRDLIAKKEYKGSFSVTFGSLAHRVSLAVNNRGEVLMIDPNQLPFRVVAPDKLAEEVKIALMYSPSSYYPLSTSVISVEGNHYASEVKQQVADVNQVKNDFFAIAERKYPPDEEMLIHLAAREGDLDVFDRYKQAIYSEFCKSESKPNNKLLSAKLEEYVTKKSNKEYHVLHIASGRGNNQFIERFFKEINNAKNYVDSPAAFSFTPLHLAVFGRNKTTAELLLDHKADIHSLDKSGNDVLHYAVNNGDVAMVEMLLKRGAKAALSNHKGKTALHLALLQDSKAQHFAATVEEGKKAIAKLLIKLTTVNDIDNKDRNSCTPLYYAVQSGDLAAIDLLLQQKANPAVKCKNDMSPIQLALINNNRHIIDRFIQDNSVILDEKKAKNDVKDFSKNMDNICFSESVHAKFCQSSNQIKKLAEDKINKKEIDSLNVQPPKKTLSIKFGNKG